MINTFEKTEQLAVDVKKYIHNRIESYELKFIEKSAQLAEAIMSYLIVCVMVFFILFFGGIALAFKLSFWLGSFPLGFLSVAVLFILIGFILLKLKHRLIYRSTLSLLMKIILKQEND